MAVIKTADKGSLSLLIAPNDGYRIQYATAGIADDVLSTVLSELRDQKTAILAQTVTVEAGFFRIDFEYFIFLPRIPTPPL